MSSTAPLFSPRQLSILLAEDDADLRFILSHSLVRGGYAVDEVSNREDMDEKISTLKETVPGQRRLDVIVSDIQLSDGSVLPVLFRHRDFISRFPTILITSDKSPEVLRKARQLGIYDVLGKPFDLPFLFATISHSIMVQQN